jgi:hypothetical protein
MQEVRIIGNNFTAEYGRAQGVVVVTTKSGTNDYHGTGFYRIRDEALNANGFANNANRIPRGPFKSNTFGGTVGERVIRDKFEHLRRSSARTGSEVQVLDNV